MVYSSSLSEIPNFSLSLRLKRTWLLSCCYYHGTCRQFVAKEQPAFIFSKTGLPSENIFAIVSRSVLGNQHLLNRPFLAPILTPRYFITRKKNLKTPIFKIQLQIGQILDTLFVGSSRILSVSPHQRVAEKQTKLCDISLSSSFDTLFPL